MVLPVTISISEGHQVHKWGHRPSNYLWWLPFELDAPVEDAKQEVSRDPKT
jgi:hypothetical protein